MPGCCVPKCSSTEQRTTYSFHRFPKNEIVKKIWLKNMRRTKWVPPANARICSWHFLCGGKIPVRFKWNHRKLETKARRHMQRRRFAPSGNDNVMDGDFSTPPMRMADDGNEVLDTVVDVDTPPMRIGPHYNELVEENFRLRAEVFQLRKENMLLRMRFRFSVIEDNDHMIHVYTGLPNRKVFMLICDVMKTFPVQYHQNWQPKCLAIEDQVLISLMKLRRNMHVDDLAFRFEVSRTTISNCVVSVVNFISETMYPNLILKRFPSYAKVKASMGNVACPSQIWDCTDAFIECPRSSITAMRSTYSAYRGGYTLKCLVSIAPNGAILFVSDFYGGCISDKELVRKCGIMEYLKPGDMVYADKGFLVHDILPNGVRINVPSFLDSTSRQFTADQVQFSLNISTVRIHVERCIQRIKAYQILQCISHHYRIHASAFLKCIAVLVNLQPSIIKNDKP